MLSQWKQLFLVILTMTPHSEANLRCTDNFFSEVLILSSTNPQYDKRLFIELQIQYMTIASSEHVVYINCSECQNKNKKTICVHNMF